MGISGLLPFVKKSSRPCFLREFSGSVAAIDSYCWLHKGAFSCAEKLVRGEETDGYVVYVMKMVRLLLSHRIKPVMVFDGCNLPSKAGTEAKRRESRAKNRALAAELLREGRVREARECFQRCLDVTSSMARAVIRACRDINVDVVVAPYEADAQLAYLAREGFVDLVITEDSDLLLFGCEKVLFKLDSGGSGVLVEQSKLHLSMGLPPDKFSLELFRNMCVLSGCDYLPSLPGIGLAKALKFFSLTSNTDTFNVLCKLPAYLKMPQLEVSLEYREGFQRAVDTFLYQLVFCTRTRRLRPLVLPSDGSEPGERPYAGAFMGHERALQIALGNVDLQTNQLVDRFDPDTHQAPASKSSSSQQSFDQVAPYMSIWQPDYDRSAVHKQRPGSNTAPSKPRGLAAFVTNDSRQRNQSGLKGRGALDTAKRKEAEKTKHGEVKKIVDIKTMFTKRKREQDEEDNKHFLDLVSLYSCPSKTQKKEDVPEEEHDKPSVAVSPAQSVNRNSFLDQFRCTPHNPFAKSRAKQDPGKRCDGLVSPPPHPAAQVSEEADTDSAQRLLLTDVKLETSPPVCVMERQSPEASEPALEDVQLSTAPGAETEQKPVMVNPFAKSKTIPASAGSLRHSSSMGLCFFNTSASKQNRRIILKSRYFRPTVFDALMESLAADSAPSPLSDKQQNANEPLSRIQQGNVTLVPVDHKQSVEGETSSRSEKQSLNGELLSTNTRQVAECDQVLTHQINSLQRSTTEPINVASPSDAYCNNINNKFLRSKLRDISNGDTDDVTGSLPCSKKVAPLSTTPLSRADDEDHPAEKSLRRRSSSRTSIARLSQDSNWTANDSLDRDSFVLTPLQQSEDFLTPSSQQLLSQGSCMGGQQSPGVEDHQSLSEELQQHELEVKLHEDLYKTEGHGSSSSKIVQPGSPMELQDEDCNGEQDSRGWADRRCNMSVKLTDTADTRGKDSFSDSTSEQTLAGATAFHHTPSFRSSQPFTSHSFKGGGSGEMASNASPYFSKKSLSSTKFGSCRRPGLSRPTRGGGRQLSLLDMFGAGK